MKFSYNLDFRELASGLTRLTLDDNFDSYIAADVTISAGAEKGISYNLPGNRVAKYWIMLRHSGNGLVTDGATDWTARQIYLKNNGAEAVTITIAILGA